MTKGKQLGEFSAKFTSFTLTPGPGGSIVTQGNYEGLVTGEVAGTLIGTVTFVGGKSGTYSLCVSVYLDDGNEMSATGSGTYESSGKHRWSTQGVAQLPDGRTIILTGEVDLASRSWTGESFEQS